MIPQQPRARRAPSSMTAMVLVLVACTSILTCVSRAAHSESPTLIASAYFGMASPVDNHVLDGYGFAPDLAHSFELQVQGASRISASLGFSAASFQSGSAFRVLRDPRYEYPTHTVGIASKSVWSVGPRLHVRLLGSPAHRAQIGLWAGPVYHRTVWTKSGERELLTDELRRPENDSANALGGVVGGQIQVSISDATAISLRTHLLLGRGDEDLDVQPADRVWFLELGLSYSLR